MAVVLALMMVSLLGSLGGALMLLSAGETQIVGSYQAGHEALHAAEAAIEISLNHLALLPDWNAAAVAGLRSTYVVGPAAGVRRTAAGAIDPTVETNAVRAGSTIAWQLYGYGPLASLAGVPGLDSETYVIVWLGGHPVDGGPDTAAVLAHGYGPFGVRRAVEALVVRSPLSGVRVTAWREVR